MKTSIEIRQKINATMHSCNEMEKQKLNETIDKFTETWYAQTDCPIYKDMSIRQFAKTFGDFDIAAERFQAIGFKVSIKKRGLRRFVRILASEK